ncbi:MAG TPA: HAD-IC family P-type ATPase [Jatrophihabitans sp.]|jgi:cation-transporting ATPase E|uniref:HAD-IC family P-type ATPase n=1 Tax=Jatrophihabitans sp. TaxID=1932789 RepID=UPI002EF4CE14
MTDAGLAPIALIGEPVGPVRPTVAEFLTPHSGLSGAEVAERVARGQANVTDSRTSRTIGEIVRSNVLTVFNALLVTLFVVILFTGRWQNGLFGLVIIANAAIGIVQESRAKRTLDRLAVLNAPHARVVRDGVPAAEVAVAEVVLDDLLVVQAGDQVPADGTLRESSGLEIDESLLTGESEPVAKVAGDHVRSGSIVVAGQGQFQATAVGADAYVTRLTAEARRYRVTHSELVSGTNRLLRWISVALAVMAPLLVWSQFGSADNHGWRDAVTGTVAALVGMVPEGLVLLTSLAFMIATLSLARRSTLVQELPAVEALARVDVICLDKTGTLTYGDIRFDRLEVCPGADDIAVRAALSLLTRADDANATAAALSAVFTDDSWQPANVIPFSSARKWSAISVDEHGSWILGAPEMVLHTPTSPAQVDARAHADTLAAAGSRVLLLAATGSEEGLSSDAGLPKDVRPAALVVLAEHVREDAEATLRYFTEQGVGIKVLSGDNPRTVGAVAAALHLPGVGSAADAVDARTLPEDLDELAAVLDTHSVFGRVTPHQKRAVVQALRRQGHVVAMTGDGVNDALALKDADIGIAMGNGTPATRAVAQIVLLDGSFAHLPDVVGEGRRVIANIERAASLFLVKNIYALVLAIIVTFTQDAYPLAPIQLTLISAVTIGIPGFALALGPNNRRYRPGYLRRVLRFAIPTGIVTGACAYLGYQSTRLIDHGAEVAEARTTATLTVLIVSLWTLLVLARPLAGWKLALVASLGAAVALIVAIPALGHGVFLLDVTPLRLAIAGIIGAVGAVLVELTHRSITLLVRLGSDRGDGSPARTTEPVIVTDVSSPA